MHEIIRTFGEDSTGLKHRYWSVMTTRSCNFNKTQHRQLRMGYDYEIGQQVHLKLATMQECQLDRAEQ